MAGIDKAAIAFSIAIVAVGVGFAFYMGTVQDAAPVVSSPVVSKTVEPKTQTDPFADIANKVKEGTPVQEKPVVKQEEKPVVKQEEKPVVKQEEKPVVKQETVKAGPKIQQVFQPSISHNQCWRYS